MNPAAALGYAVPASVAAAPRAAQHLPLGFRFLPAASGASLWFPKENLQQNEQSSYQKARKSHYQIS